MPLVAVQIFVGVALGPSILGRVAPDVYQTFASPPVLTGLTGVATLAVIIFGMISGLHVDPRVFRGDQRAFWGVAAASIAVPMALGCMAGLWILTRYPDELLPGVKPVEFIAAVGICLSMNALPVLGAILGEMDLLGSCIGHLALGVAGINNMALWLVLAILLATGATEHAKIGHELPLRYLLVLSPAYLILMVWIVRPALSNLVTVRMGNGGMNTRAAVVVVAATIASALVTDLAGLHYIIGAFVLGAILPSKLHRPILDCLQVVTVAVLMPFFFTLTGMRTMLDLTSPELLEIFVVTTGCAAVGIIGGTAVAARALGETWSFAVGLGCLLQSKGLTELIVLTVLLDARIVSPKIFASMLLMALFSTAIAMPLARLALARSAERQAISNPKVLQGQRP